MSKTVILVTRQGLGTTAPEDADFGREMVSIRRRCGRDSENGLNRGKTAHCGRMLHAFGECLREMLDKFFHTLERQPEKPHAICFYTDGVNLLAEGSSLVLGLKLLESLGVRIVVCQSCLNHFGLQDRLAVGTIGGMPDIVQLMWEADKVITV
ncbi:MAG: DsrE family protein [Pirellulaceae bacterium]